MRDGAQRRESEARSAEIRGAQRREIEARSAENRGAKRREIEARSAENRGAKRREIEARSAENRGYRFVLPSTIDAPCPLTVYSPAVCNRLPQRGPREGGYL